MLQRYTASSRKFAKMPGVSHPREDLIDKPFRF
jgi:hypothetical protein